uniref:ATP-binding protein n=1 Tax=Eubacterium cellulosolvens TaxID=29322 RepID=UPI0005562F7D|nr:ATP-binding protein [[Eubacterium] cellulosolvens]
MNGNVTVELTVESRLENVELLTDWINTVLDGCDYPRKIQTKMDVVIDELFSNIVYYAYPDTVGDTTVRLQMPADRSGLTMTFIDSGEEYNPLFFEDPDITLSADDRSLGGLGILIVKSLMDDVRYERRDNQNLLTLYKSTA